MRVYVPGTFATLRMLAADGELPAPQTAFAVTAGLREWYATGEQEELEYAATGQAARAALRLLDADPKAPRRRVVIAADVRDAIVTVRDDLDVGVVRLNDGVAVADVAAVLTDDADAENTVAAAARAIDAADLGDQAAQDTVDDAEGYELAWYATQEIEQLLRDTRTGPDHGAAS